MKYIKEWGPYVGIILLVILLRAYIITPVRVEGKSMDPTLQNNEILLLKKYDKKIDRFDIVVLRYNGDKLIKRVIGLPGEHIKYEDGILYINQKKVDENFHHGATLDFDLKELGYEVIPDNCYLVLGDNRMGSLDSRVFGPVSKNKIEGITDFSLFPFSKFGAIK